MRRVVILLVLLIASSCGSGDTETAATTTTTIAVSTTATTLLTSSTTEAPTTTIESTTTTVFDPTLELLSLTQARQRWADSAPVTYQWTYQMVCECDPGPWTILIDGAVLEVVNDSQMGTEPPFLSVDDLFDEIEAVLEVGRFPVRVNYDEINGVPSVYVFNEPDLPVDGGFIFELEHFEPNPQVEIDYPDTCSTEGWEVALVAQDLPDPVAETRQQIYDAAMRCDFEALRQLSRAGLPDSLFETSFGGAGVELFWEKEARGEPILQEVVNHFNQPVVMDGSFYIWPSAFITLEAADGTGMDPVEYEQLLELYTVEELQEMFDGIGSYVSWRTAIGEDGVWVFFIAGD